MLLFVDVYAQAQISPKLLIHFHRCFALRRRTRRDVYEMFVIEYNVLRESFGREANKNVWFFVSAFFDDDWRCKFIAICASEPNKFHSHQTRIRRYIAILFQLSRTFQSSSVACWFFISALCVLCSAFHFQWRRRKIAIIFKTWTESSLDRHHPQRALGRDQERKKNFSFLQPTYF